jgi:hypothetical protein
MQIGCISQQTKFLAGYFFCFTHAAQAVRGWQAPGAHLS